MDDSLYDTSWILYTIPSLSTPLNSLLAPPPSSSQSTTFSALDQHAKILHNSLIDRQRPRYEDEEEKEKLGGLRACTWTRLSGGTRREARTRPIVKQKRKREEMTDDDKINLEQGLLVSLVYDKTTYKFAIFAAAQPETSTKRPRFSAFRPPAPRTTETKPDNQGIVLAKASPSAFKAFQSYLSDMFAIKEINALKLPPQFLQSTIAKYISTIHTGLSRTTSERQLPLDIKAVLGMMKISISFSAPIAPSLKMLDVEVPSETILAAISRIDPDKRAENHDRHEPEQQENATETVLDVLKQSIYERTGLKLPLSQDEKPKDPDPADQTEDNVEPTPADATAIPTTAPATTDDNKPEPEPEPPMRISRILSAAFAISSEGRLKLALKAAETCDSEGEGNHDNEDSTLQPNSGANVVRVANEALLKAVLLEARRQKREDA
ncbi:hypothetical protein LTR84_005166 [Exophiala bonariae]|uniref:Uncharacterized protein n=1 Tax=Exophiala bonariae TaxID=1690606 RepID=A0AAV9NT02_9EURO|nr:hypothetical protein LTR84_005166 [Exophiala bonariae]